MDAQTSNANGSNIPIDCCVYKAAINPQTVDNIDSSKLQENLYRVTTGGRNTVLHLASAAENLPFIQQILRLSLQPGFIEKANAKGNTALHEAVQSGHYKVVELLLNHKGLINMHNTLNNQTPLFKACEGGHDTIVEKLLEANPSKLLEKSSDGRTCLHAVVNGGHAGLLNKLLTDEKNICENERRDWERKRRDLVKEIDGQGNTVLHLAVRRNRLDMVMQLLEFECGLSYSLNHEKETAICVAVKLGFLPVVEALVNCSPDSIEITSKSGKNILHLAVELSQVKILNFLVKSKVDLSQLINQSDEASPKDNTRGQEDRNQSRGDTPLHIATRNKNVYVDLSLLISKPDEAPPKDSTLGQEDGNQSGGNTMLRIVAKNKNVYMDLSLLHNQHDESGGDTPLHIAARNKNVYMVDLLLKVRGVNKNAVNNAGLTPLDIAKQNTEYHEPFKIIEKLSDYPERRRPFLYSAPTMSLEKKKNALEILDKIFGDRGNAELVVAVLLATMAFQAVFTVPGSFHSDTNDKETLGVPVLIGFDSFKLFLVFDCLAFFLSLFVVLMWEMSTVLTTTDKMLFIYITNGAVCAAFAFTAFGLMAALYMVLAHKVKKFAWIVLGSSMLIALCGTTVFLYIIAKFTVRRARFHRLCGVPRLLDDIVENVWVMAETHGILDFARAYDEFLHHIVSGNNILGFLHHIVSGNNILGFLHHLVSLVCRKSGGEKSPQSQHPEHHITVSRNPCN